MADGEAACGGSCLECAAHFAAAQGVHTGFGCEVEGSFDFLFRDDVDAAGEGRRTVDERRWAVYDLDALDVGKVNGEIEAVVAGVGVGEVDAVEEDGCLVG